MSIFNPMALPLTPKRAESREELVKLVGMAESHAARINRFRNEIPVNANVVAGALYSRIDIASLLEFTVNRTTIIQFFDYGDQPGNIKQLGGESRPTLVDTNVPKAHGLPVPEGFAVKGIGFAFSPDTDPGDRVRFSSSYVLEFWIGQRNYFRRPIAELFSVGNGNLVDPLRPLSGYVDLSDFPLTFNYEHHFSGQAIGSPFENHKPIRAWMIVYGLHMRGIC
jgi:hypothetical protein